MALNKDLILIEELNEISTNVHKFVQEFNPANKISNFNDKSLKNSRMKYVIFVEKLKTNKY